MYHSVVSKRNLVGAAVVTAALALLGSGRALAADPVVKCRQAISAAGQKYEDARSKALAKCEESKVKGKFAADLVCGAAAPSGDQKTFDKIAKAQGKLDDAITKSCCGKDKTCGAGGDDQPLAAIGWNGRVAACDLGERDGESCQTNADCPGVCNAGQRQGLGVQCPVSGAINAGCPSFCSGTCAGGVSVGQLCTADVNCPGSTCTSRTCKGGTNNGNVCVVVTDCPGNNTCTASNGCGANGKTATVCPDIESEGCNGAVANGTDISSCLECAGNTGVDQLIGLFYSKLNPPDATLNKDLQKCKATIGKAGAKFFSAKRKALAGCEKGAIKDGLPAGTCPDAAKATPKINAAKDKLLAAIAKACGGDDKAFGGTGADADFSPSAIGAALSCPNVTIPGGANCYGFINTVQDLANCVYCLSEYKADVLDALAAPSNGAYPATAANPLCGNGKIEVGETCDDGNNVDGDACPANCVIGSCTSPSGTTTVTLTFTPPTGVSAVAIYLDYPDAGVPNVRIPGAGNTAQVQARITPADGNTNFTANDVDYAIRVLLQTNDQTAMSPTTLQIQFDRCGAAPALSAYNCRVESATGPLPDLINVTGTLCTVS